MKFSKFSTHVLENYRECLNQQHLLNAKNSPCHEITYTCNKLSYNIRYVIVQLYRRDWINKTYPLGIGEILLTGSGVERSISRPNPSSSVFSSVLRSYSLYVLALDPSFCNDTRLGLMEVYQQSYGTDSRITSDTSKTNIHDTLNCSSPHATDISPSKLNTCTN